MAEKSTGSEKRGRPRSDNAAHKTLAGVRVTELQLSEYRKAAEDADKPMAAWVKDALESALNSSDEREDAK